MLCDTHCHIFNEYYENIDEIIENAKSNDVDFIIVNGVDRKSNEEILELVRKYDIIYGALGIQPEEVKNMNDDDIEFIRAHINDEKIIAVGEIGLDYHWGDDRDLQKKIFKKQLDIAAEYNMPVIVHSRDSIQDTYNILKEYNVKGILHCYSGSVEMANEFTKIGFLLGIGGVLTFKNGVKLVDVVKNVDIKNIVVETDSPYLSPEPYRGKRNEPKNVKVIYEKICDIKGLGYNELCDAVNSNICCLFDK